MSNKDAAERGSSQQASRKECTSIYRNLLSSMDNDSGMPAWMFFRELKYTQKCDGVAKWSDMRDIRSDVAEHMDVSSLDTIPMDNVDSSMNARAACALMHYKLQLHNRLAWALPAGGLAKYCTYDKWQQFLATIGAGAATVKMARANSKRMRDMFKMKGS